MYRDFCGENRLSLKIWLFYFAFGWQATQWHHSVDAAVFLTTRENRYIIDRVIKLKIFAIPWCSVIFSLFY